MSEIYIGIDPSLTATGIVVIDKYNKILDHKLIETKPTGKELKDMVERIHLITSNITRIISRYYWGQLGKVVYERFIGGMAREAYTRGMLDAMFQNSIMYSFLHVPLIYVHNKHVKKFATGEGNAAKDMVAVGAYKHWGVDYSTFPVKVSLVNNLIDAYVLAQIGRATMYKDGFTKYQLEVVKEYSDG